MIKILLVDDEPLFTEFLQGIVNWGEYGCKICGIAEDGETAMEQIRVEKPDIIFLDINIPIINGIEVLKKVREHDLNVQVIIVSAHNDFQFAQTAIKNGVADYLLKPFNKDEFLVALNHCLENVKIARGCFLQRCIQGKEEMQGEYAIIIFIKSITEQELYLLGEKIDRDFDACYGESMYYIENERIIFACNGEMIGDEELYEFFSEYVDEDTIVSIGDISCNIINSYMNANKALEQRVINEENIIQYRDIKARNGSVGISFSENDFTRLIGCLNNGDQKGVVNIINKLFLLDRNREISFLYLMSVLSAFTLNMANHYGKTRVDVEELLLKHTYIKKDISKVTDKKILFHIIREYVYELFEECSKEVPATKQKELVEKINKYIKKNYKHRGFTLEKMATELLFENSYMRRVYKNETGTTILKALEDYRINEAKRMLTTRIYKHSEIAAMNGFADQYYFSKRFKQIVGCTPSEYEVRKNDK